VAAITVGGQRCEPAGLLDLSVVCDFDVSVRVLGAAGGEVVTGTLTATNEGAAGSTQSAPFRLPVAQRGGSTVSATVTVRFTLCAHGVATARTQPASSAPSNQAAFSGCGSILGL
jgi:hypothetical protein